MRLRFDWKFMAGSLATLATLALSSPGVRVVRAEDELREDPAGPIVEGPSCQLGSLELRQAPAQVILERDPSGEADASTIALNNRGYNYRPAAVHPEAIER